ncbi:phage antirepressor KilAC domain-containing protein [Lentzea albida]|uniref:Prophage antirepressor n=1 Tax=Lentzea albida TaxID=65499 RepID=A0A1H9VJB8_9PSEU|nr:phage antirepressor KilAC domain-containing protein [Lentzea albida]SES21303.1 Prophage antirepressor [Lentzea albida]
MTEINLFTSNMGLEPEHFGLTRDGTGFVLALPFARALGKRDAHDALRLLDADEWCPHIVRADGTAVRENVILEDGIWELIFVSRTPTAKAIKARVKAILRQLRETGVVDMRPDLSDPLLELQRASESLSRSVALALAERKRAESAESNVRALTPAANAWAAFLDAGRSMEVGAAAKCLAAHGVDTGRTRLYSLLREWRWVFQRSREPMGSAVERGYVRLALDKPHTNPKTGEEEDGSARTRITGKGLERLADHFGVRLDLDIVNQYLEQQERAA